MSGADVVIRAEGLGKSYVIGHQAERERVPTLRDAIARTAGRVVRSAADLARGRPMIAGDDTEEFWALKDASFEIGRGDVVGIIGRNGAGKSTLLKILSRITEPSEGRVEIRGRVASLLEVGTGFHPELSGRQNIYLNGAILGMTQREIRRKFDEIVEFAGVEKFLDTPVKRFSSGMYVRLAFAVAAHLDPEILVVDEVLAVGDAEFQRRCLGKMQQVASTGRTVIFVSHNLGVIRRLCERVFVLDAGTIVHAGSAETGIGLYERSMRTASVLSDLSFKGGLTDAFRFQRIRYLQNGQVVEHVDANAPLRVEVEGEALRPLRALDIKLTFFRDGTEAFSCYDTDEPADLCQGSVTSTFDIPKDTLTAGAYTLGLGASESGGLWSWGEDVQRLEVSWASYHSAAGRHPGPVRVRYASSRASKVLS